MNLPRPGDTKYQVLTAIEDYWKDNPRGPTVEELRLALNLGTRSSVQFHIDDLKELGLVENLPRKARSIRPTPRGKKLIKIFASIDEPPVKKPFRRGPTKS